MKTICSECKKEKQVRKDVLDKRLKQFGVKSVEELNKVYKCQTCRPKKVKEKKNLFPKPKSSTPKGGTAKRLISIKGEHKKEEIKAKA